MNLEPSPTERLIRAILKKMEKALREAIGNEDLVDMDPNALADKVAAIFGLPPGGGGGGDDVAAALSTGGGEGPPSAGGAAIATVPGSSINSKKLISLLRSSGKCTRPGAI